MKRALYSIIKTNLYKGKTILLFGARRVGKTHLIKQIVQEEEGQYYSGEWIEVRELLSRTSLPGFREFIKGKKLVVIDEAQSIPEIGLKLKVLHDEFPQVQFIATGSSAFELAQQISEPLTGRSRYLRLYPISFEEIREEKSFIDAYSGIESMLRFGSYPEVVLKPENERKEELLNIVSSYLYKDVVAYGQLRRPDLVDEILKLLAFQIGNEVSLNEISNKTNTTIKTVMRYIDILEKAFVITSLRSFSRNLRNEIGKTKKYYFIDIGIRNAIINNFNPLTTRNDVGQLWENFCILERIKKNEYSRRFVNSYFWRTYDQKEIDYIEEIDGKLYAYEFKWNEDVGKPPKAFIEAYPGSDYKVISKNNFIEFI
ncbi:MAG: ATP-binding protein [Saprospiraceae bacterium]|uniref:ATP-binding protein n=1 Tax=Candidatus Opimibacter skivensis TaxID=2982028 RepID=A0A9D7XTW9_9BACT|nr:ATP-binding protein [Candidatus Opimibacter skivensis]